MQRSPRNIHAKHNKTILYKIREGKPVLENEKQSSPSNSPLDSTNRSSRKYLFHIRVLREL